VLFDKARSCGLFCSITNLLWDKNMAKAKTAYVCTECGADYGQWQGQCNACGAWNTIKEVRLSPAKSKPPKQAVRVIQGSLKIA
jgi:predicted ATP-dependent serine protease